MMGEEMERVVTALEGALGDLVGSGDVEIAVDADGGEIEVVADEWTLNLGHRGGALTAFLAIDDEPDDAARIAAARTAAMGEAATTALSVANAQLAGGIATALRRSGDPLSLDLATAIG